jgi:deoxyribose-phosphate aldolase
MDIENYLESTYLKTTEDSNLSNNQIKSIIKSLVNEALANNFKLIMVRENHLSYVESLLMNIKSNLLIGTVVDFPLGDKSTIDKIKELNSVLNYNVSDIDFVCDYNAFKRKDFEKFDTDVTELSSLCLKKNKTVKWIIETGALSKKEIFDISERISEIINKNFTENLDKFFIKTSTGYYSGYGANLNDIKIIKRASKNISIKASGGIKCFNDAINMIELGVDRIGTSSALDIYNKK